MLRTLFFTLALAGAMTAEAQSKTTGSVDLWKDLPVLQLDHTAPLPPPDPEFDKTIKDLVKETGLDKRTPASGNPDGVEAWGSICVVDFSSGKPIVGGWEMENMVYPASSYKMYVLGEVIRQVCSGERTLDDPTTISAHNVREDLPLTADSTVPLSEVLRLMCAYSNNTAANVAIDVADRRRVSSLLRALDCEGSEITRKFLPRSREDEGFTTAPGTMSNALHFARFLWAVENGVIGGGKGRGLIKGYLATNEQNKTRVRAGVPETATVYSKTGEWNTFTTEAALVEDGTTRYIIVIMTARPIKEVAPLMAEFARKVHVALSKAKE